MAGGLAESSRLWRGLAGRERDLTIVNRDTPIDIKTRIKSGLIIILPILLVFIVVSANYFTEEHLLKRSNKVIAMKMSAVQSFLQEASFLAGIELKAAQNRGASIDEIHKIDRKWIHYPNESALLSDLLKNDLSWKLSQFQRKNPAFKELFITDSRGLIIALTNPRIDYYQADEEWWNLTLEQGNHVGGIEYDESAQTSFYGIYRQIKNQKGEVLGILKGVLDAYDVRILGEKMEQHGEG